VPLTKQFGKSVGLRAPGMFIELLRRTGAAYGRHPGRASPRTQPDSRSSVMAAESLVPKPLWQRWHACPCGIGPIQRDLYSALTFRLSGSSRSASLVCPVPGVTLKVGSPACRQHTSTMSNARVRGSLCLAASRIPGERARLPKSPSRVTQEPLSRRSGEVGNVETEQGTERRSRLERSQCQILLLFLEGEPRCSIRTTYPM
jgi:hypothetical protein